MTEKEKTAIIRELDKALDKNHPGANPGKHIYNAIKLVERIKPCKTKKS